MYEKILVPLDGSALAESVLPYVEALARSCGSEVVLLRVIRPPGLYAPAEVEYAIDMDEVRAKVQEYLEGVDTRLEEKGIASRWVLLEGPVADSIVDYAETEKVSLIAMCTHGRSGVGRWLYGSVAARVLEKAPCPVLLVRARQ